MSCPFDENHKLPPQSLEKHISKCSLRKENYDLNEEYLSAPNDQAGQSILIGTEIVNMALTNVYNVLLYLLLQTMRKNEIFFQKQRRGMQISKEVSMSATVHLYFFTQMFNLFQKILII